MINVCFLIGGFEGRGGIGRVTSTIINSLAKEDNIEITTVSFLKEKEYNYELDKKVKKKYLFEYQTSMTKAILKKRASAKLKTVLRENDIEIIIACGILFYPLAYLATIGTNIKTAFVEHTNPETGHDFKCQKITRRLSALLSKRVIVISDSARKWYLQKNISPKKITLIYNGIPQETYSTKNYNTESKKIISVGRLSYQKNFTGLIDVAEMVLKKNPEWIWDIYGDGEEEKKLKEIIAQKALEKNLRLRGTSNQILEKYRESAFVVMTSRYEGFPMTLIEAAANRLPMIAYDVKTGPNEIIKDGSNGFLVDFENKRLMAQKIEDLICSQEKRAFMSNNSFQSSKAFSIDLIKRQWMDLFHKMIINEYSSHEQI